MNTKRLLAAFCLAAGVAGAAPAMAAEVLVGDPAPGRQPADVISVSTVWTADNVYNLQDQIFVAPGATLVIEPGTVVASTPTANGSGSLAVTRGAKIFVQGTAENPVIMTSSNDVATWDPDPSHPTGGDPKTGTWREAANEWGNLTIMGRAFVSNTIDVPANSAAPAPTNISPMEGLTGVGNDDPFVFFGGGDDDDSSGSITYLSIRYAGRVVGLGNELNGLSLGGIGRGTDINHLEIMNNVDDGIEVWGGTFNLKNFAVWNVGDDSLDIDQGWRGKAQFGLIVQGFSVDASQGSGVGDNAIEIDGAEQADAQPVTTATLYNLTVIGQPIDGDGGTAWRDGARVQVRNSVFMDLGEKLVRPDWSDFEGSGGYGLSGTLGFDEVWITAFDSAPAHPNDPADRAAFYQAQSAGDPSIGQGFLAEITDSVFFRNLNNAYSQTPSGGNQIPDGEELGSDQIGVTVTGGSNPAKGNVVIGGDFLSNDGAPIVDIVRGPVVVRGTKNVVPVTFLDPRAANDATTSVATAPADGFFTQAPYRGAFSPNFNWLAGWTAAEAFGFTSGENNAAQPEASVALQTTTVSFNTEDGVIYTVESSTNGLIWTPVQTIVGTGAPVVIEDLLGADFDGTLLYRAVVQ